MENSVHIHSTQVKQFFFAFFIFLIFFSSRISFFCEKCQCRNSTKTNIVAVVISVVFTIQGRGGCRDHITLAAPRISATSGGARGTPVSCPDHQKDVSHTSGAAPTVTQYRENSQLIILTSKKLTLVSFITLRDSKAGTRAARTGQICSSNQFMSTFWKEKWFIGVFCWKKISSTGFPLFYSIRNKIRVRR